MVIKHAGPLQAKSHYRQIHYCTFIIMHLLLGSLYIDATGRLNSMRMHYSSNFDLFVHIMLHMFSLEVRTHSIILLFCEIYLQYSESDHQQSAL